MSVPYYGDYPEDFAGIKIPFNTFSSDDPSKSCTITELADADIKVYKDGGDTEIGTDGASVLINFDGHTGAHLITIDTSVHSDYATGSEYAVLIDGTVIDAATDMDMWIGTFSIERAGGVLAYLKAGSTVAASVSGAVGSVAGNVDGSVATCAAATVSAIGNDVITPASVDEDADFTIQALSITNALDAGSVLVDGTTTLTGNVSCGAGFDVVGALSANSVLVDAGMDIVGELSMNSLLVDTTATVSGNALITGTTTHTRIITIQM